MDQSMMDATKRQLAEAQVPPPFTSMNLKAAFVRSIRRNQAWLQATESHLRFAKLAARETD
jgi:hypothetical protein